VQVGARGRARSARECTVSPRQSASSHSSSPRPVGVVFRRIRDLQNSRLLRGLGILVSRSCCSWYGARSTGPREALRAPLLGRSVAVDPSVRASPSAPLGAALKAPRNRKPLPAPVADQLRPRERRASSARPRARACSIAVFPHRSHSWETGGTAARDANRDPAVDDLPADHGEERLDVLDPVLRTLKYRLKGSRGLRIPRLQSAFPCPPRPRPRRPPVVYRRSASVRSRRFPSPAASRRRVLPGHSHAARIQGL